MPNDYYGFGLTSGSLKGDQIKQLTNEKCVFIKKRKLQITLVGNKKVGISEVKTKTQNVKKVILKAKHANGSPIKVGHYIDVSMQICSAFQRL